MRTTILLAALPLLVACASGPKTRTGRPEVAIVGSKAAVRDALVIAMGQRGYGVDRTEESSLVLSKLSDSLAASMLLGSQFNRNVWVRVTYTLAAASDLVHVFGRVEAVTNRGSAFEKTADFSEGKDGEAIQGVLEKVRDEVEWPLRVARAQESVAGAR